MPNLSLEDELRIVRTKKALQEEGPSAPEAVLALCLSLSEQVVLQGVLLKQATRRIAELEFGGSKRGPC
jgi:hypothetical protein